MTLVINLQDVLGSEYGMVSSEDKEAKEVMEERGGGALKSGYGKHRCQASHEDHITSPTSVSD